MALRVYQETLGLQKKSLEKKTRVEFLKLKKNYSFSNTIVFKTVKTVISKHLIVFLKIILFFKITKNTLHPKCPKFAIWRGGGATKPKANFRESKHTYSAQI